MSEDLAYAKQFMLGKDNTIIHQQNMNAELQLAVNVLKNHHAKQKKEKLVLDKNIKKTLKVFEFHGFKIGKVGVLLPRKTRLVSHYSEKEAKKCLDSNDQYKKCFLFGEGKCIIFGWTYWHCKKRRTDLEDWKQIRIYWPVITVEGQRKWFGNIFVNNNTKSGFCRNKYSTGFVAFGDVSGVEERVQDEDSGDAPIKPQNPTHPAPFPF